MNAYELADELTELIVAPTPVDDGDACRLIDSAAITLRQQADRIEVLEANHKLQLDINDKELQYISKLEKRLRSSLDLNKAQAQRQEQVMELVMQKLAFEKENAMLHERVKQLEAQVYGGTAK